LIDPGNYRKDSPFAEQHPLVTPATSALTAWSATTHIDELAVARRGGPAQPDFRNSPHDALNFDQFAICKLLIRIITVTQGSLKSPCSADLLY
jgi:hypothetical protein